MSVAARGALTLNELLKGDLSTDRLAKEFFAAIQPIIETPWQAVLTAHPATKKVLREMATEYRHMADHLERGASNAPVGVPLKPDP